MSAAVLVVVATTPPLLLRPREIHFATPQDALGIERSVDVNAHIDEVALGQTRQDGMKVLRDSFVLKGFEARGVFVGPEGRTFLGAGWF